MSPAPVKRPATYPASVKRPATSPAPIKRSAMSPAPLTNHNCCIALITLLPVANRQHADLVLLPGKSLGELAGLGHGCLLQPAAAGVSQGGAVPDEEALLSAGCRRFPSDRYDLVILRHRHVRHGKRFWAKTKTNCLLHFSTWLPRACRSPLQSGHAPSPSCSPPWKTVLKKQTSACLC